METKKLSELKVGDVGQMLDHPQWFVMLHVSRNYCQLQWEDGNRTPHYLCNDNPLVHHVGKGKFAGQITLSGILLPDLVRARDKQRYDQQLHRGKEILEPIARYLWQTNRQLLGTTPGHDVTVHILDQALQLLYDLAEQDKKGS